MVPPLVTYVGDIGETGKSSMFKFFLITFKAVAKKVLRFKQISHIQMISGSAFILNYGKHLPLDRIVHFYSFEFLPTPSC